MPVATLLVILELFTESLKTFNLVYADQPVAQRKANALVFWNVIKIFIWPLLTDDQRKLIEAVEKQNA